ncbi:MAG: nuclear transport factor 2 family protein [Candidatus Binataceae bacterium]
MTTQAADEAEVARLDDGWNEAYVRRKRGPLAEILAEDFSGLTPSGEPITKALLMSGDPGTGVVKLVSFSEQDVRVFGDTAISRGRLKLEVDDLRFDQRFLRVFAKRGGVWRAVAVSVTPVAENRG